MPKNFNDFLKTVDYKKISEETFNEFSKKNINDPPEVTMYKAIPEVSIKLLEKYHNWINS